VPKHSIAIAPRTPIDDQLKREVLRFFSTAIIEKLERLGGRITISISAPYRDPKSARPDLQIDESFLLDLQGRRSNVEYVEGRLKQLTKAQLVRLAGLIGEPLKPSITLPEMRHQLLRSIQAQDIWDRIARGASNE
jgi:hypothetical protein